MNYWLVVLPVTSAFIGWFSIWLFLRLLFHPQLPVHFLGFSIQGVYPKQHKQLAATLGKTAAEQFSTDQLEEKLASPKTIQQVMPVVETHIDEFLRVKLPKQMPMIGMLIGDKTINSLKATFMSEIEAMFPQVINQFTKNLKSELDIEKTVSDKIMLLTSDKLEKQITQNNPKAFQHAKWLGATIGFVLGLLQVGILLLVA